LKDDEKDGLEQKVIALDGISVIVNAKNGVKDLTTQQVADIFSGKITDWSQVGGKAGKISCIGRESGSGTRDGFESATGTEDKCKLEQELTSTGAVISAVGNRIRVLLRSRGSGQDSGNQDQWRNLHRRHHQRWKLQAAASVLLHHQERRKAFRRSTEVLRFRNIERCGRSDS